MPPPAAPGQEPPNVDPPVIEREPFLGVPSGGLQGGTSTADPQDSTRLDSTLVLRPGAGGLSALQGVDITSDLITSNLLTGGRFGNTGLIGGGATAGTDQTPAQFASRGVEVQTEIPD